MKNCVNHECLIENMNEMLDTEVVWDDEFTRNYFCLFHFPKCSVEQV